MINRILEFSMRQRGAVLLLALALLAAGLWSVMHLPIDAVPDLTGVQVQINSEVPAMAPEESEKAVTRPIGIEMQGLPGVTGMRSLTKFGLSQVTLNFEDGTDIYRARQLVAERLTGVLDSLPPPACRPSSRPSVPVSVKFSTTHSTGKAARRSGPPTSGRRSWNSTTPMNTS